MPKNPFGGESGEEKLIKARLDKETCKDLVGAYDEESKACFIKIKTENDGERVVAERLEMESHKPQKPETWES